MNVPPIEEMTHLAKRLGQSGMDPIRYAGKGNTSKEPNSTNLENTVIQAMQATQPNTPHCQVNELVSAAANLDGHQSKPLNINRLFNMLRCIEMINTREIITMTNLDKRQAQKYLRAIKFIIPYLESHFHSTLTPSATSHKLPLTPHCRIPEATSPQIAGYIQPIRSMALGSTNAEHIGSQ